MNPNTDPFNRDVLGDLLSLVPFLAPFLQKLPVVLLYFIRLSTLEHGTVICLLLQRKHPLSCLSVKSSELEVFIIEESF